MAVHRPRREPPTRNSGPEYRAGHGWPRGFFIQPPRLWIPYATHNHPRVCAWLAKHPPIRLPFTPISAYWSKRGAFASVTDLATAIRLFCAAWNEHSQSIAWRRPTDDTLTRFNANHLSHEALAERQQLADGLHNDDHITPE